MNNSQSEDFLKDQNLILSLEKILKEINQQFDHLSALYPQGDLRPAFFGLTGNILGCFYLHLSSAQDTICRQEWWGYKFKTPANIGQIYESAIFSKHAFFIFFLARMESLQRKTINLISPNFDILQTKTYSKHYKEYLNRLNLEKFIELFQIATYIRNTIHTNGIFFSHRGVDEPPLCWKGKEFNFKHMKPIDFLDENNLLFLVEELLVCVKEIVNAKIIKDMKFIENKFH